MRYSELCRGFQQHTGRFTAAVAHNAAAFRIRCRAGNSRYLECTTVQPERVHVVALQTHGLIGNDRIENSAGRILAAPVMRVPAAPLYPARVRLRRCDAAHNRIDARRIGQIEMRTRQRPFGQMDVGIDEAGRDGGGAEVDDFGIGRVSAQLRDRSDRAHLLPACPHCGASQAW